MATMNEMQLKSEYLLQQLRGLKYIVDANKHELNKNAVSMEFLGFKIDLAQNLIEELRLWEEIGNQNKCKDVFDNAHFFLEQALALMDRMLDEQCEEAWLDFQRELRFTNHVTIPYEYVLKRTSEHLALAT
jgi:hypothetical protein